MLLSKNTVFRDVNGCEYRVLWIHGSENMVWAIRLVETDVMPKNFSKNELIDSLINQETKIIEDEHLPEKTNEDDLTEAEKSIRDKNWERIKEIVVCEPDIYYSAERARLIKDMIKRKGGSRPTYYNALRKYWQYGCVPNALIANYSKCGCRGKKKNISDKKRGRPREITPGEGINIDDKTLKYIRLAISRKFLNSSKSSLSTSYNWFLATFFPETVKFDKNALGGNEVKILDRGKIPTFTQFKYHFKKENNEISILINRKGLRVVEKKFKALLKNSQNETSGPGTRYQIDATIIDLYVVSRFDRNRIVGRPTLYIVVDVFSRMIVGFYVGLEQPSWMTAMNALLNVIEDKVALCAKYGIEISQRDWPVAGFPARLLGDGGEIKSKSSEKLCKSFNVIVENAPPYRGDAKGVVERAFNTVQTIFKPFTPGFVEPDFRERGAHDYREDAVLTIDEVRGIIIHCILTTNLSPKREYDSDPDMVADGMAYVPVDMWHWGLECRRSDAHAVDPKYAKLNLLPDMQAKITKRGVRLFKGLYYFSQELMSEPWYVQAQEKRISVRAIYHSGDMSSIYIQSPYEKEKHYKLQLASHCLKLTGKSLTEIDELRRKERMLAAKYKDENMGRFIGYDKNIDEIVSYALAKAEEDKGSGISQAQRKKDIRKNRKEDVLIDGKKQASKFGFGEGVEDVNDYIDGEVVQEDWEQSSLAFLRAIRFTKGE